MISNYTLTLNINKFIEFYEYLSKLRESSQAKANSKTSRKPFSYFIKGPMLAQNYKFSNKNGLLPSWIDFKRIFVVFVHMIKETLSQNFHPYSIFIRLLTYEWEAFKFQWHSFNKLNWKISLEPVCCKKRQKSPNQGTGLGNRGHLKVLNDTKLVLNHLGSIWYHSQPLEVPYFPNQFLGWDFFAVSYSKPALASPKLSMLQNFYTNSSLWPLKQSLGNHSLVLEIINWSRLPRFTDKCLCCFLSHPCINSYYCELQWIFW